MTVDGITIESLKKELSECVVKARELISDLFKVAVKCCSASGIPDDFVWCVVSITF